MSDKLGSEATDLWNALYGLLKQARANEHEARVSLSKTPLGVYAFMVGEDFESLLSRAEYWAGVTTRLERQCARATAFANIQHNDATIVNQGTSN